MAQQNSPQAIQAEGTERTSKAARVSAVGAILPSATLSAGHVVQLGGGLTRLNQNGEQVTVAQKPTNNTGLSLNMTLFDGGQRLYDLRTANYQIAAAEANRIAVKYNVALGVKQQYYAVLAAIDLGMDQFEAYVEEAAKLVRKDGPSCATFSSVPQSDQKHRPPASSSGGEGSMSTPRVAPKTTLTPSPSSSWLLLTRRRENAEPHGNGAVLDRVELPRRRIREIDNAAVVGRAAVVDAHLDGAAVLQIGHEHARAKRQ